MPTVPMAPESRIGMTPEDLLSSFPNPGQIDAIFYKSLSRNDDSGRHGVLIPAHAYSFFPEFRDLDPAVNALMPIRTAWEAGGSWFEQDSNYAYCPGEYPERGLTSLLPSAVNQVSEYRLLVVRPATDPSRTGSRCASSCPRTVRRTPRRSRPSDSGRNW